MLQAIEKIHLKKILKILGRIFLILIAFILLVWILIQTAPVQNFIIKKVTARLSKELKTEVKINHVSLTLFNKMNLDGTLIRDKNKDTLLYAGALKVRITDWFFLKKNIDLSYIGLENTFINLKRRDSVWNYQFLIDYFSSPKKDTAKSATQLHLKKVDIQNLRLVQNDLWSGQRLAVTLGSCTLDADSIDFKTLDFKIKMLEINKPVVSIHSFKALNPHRHAPEPAAKDTGLYYNAAGMHVSADSIAIIDGDFSMLQKARSYKPREGFFDPDDMQFHHINISAGKYLYDKDTMTARLKMSVAERCGVEIKNLSARFRLTPQIMEFKQLDLITANSHLGNYYAMKFKTFLDGMSDFTSKVKLDAAFGNATVSSDDIAFFAPELKSWKKKWTVSGAMLGTIANFRANKISIHDQDGMIVNGDLVMRGLPNIDTTLIDAENLNIYTTFKQLLPIAPQLKNVTGIDLSTLGTAHYTGFYKGFISNFNAAGNLNTAIGSANINLTMSLPENGLPTYKANVITQDFDLGKFIGTGAIGSMAFNGNISGTSFDINSMKANLDGHFDKFEANGYPFSNIDVDGIVQKKLFKGDLKIADSNANFISNVLVDFNGNDPQFNIIGDLQNLNMQKVKFTKDNFVLTGLFDLNFSGNNIDNFLGTAKVLNVSLQRDSSVLNFDSLTVSANVDSNNFKVLTVDNNQFNAKITGIYSIMDLPTTFQSFLSNYYPALFQKPSKVPKNQHFTMELHTQKFDNYVNIIDSNLHGLDSVAMIGAINTEDSGNIYLNAYVPYVQYKKFKLQNTVIEGNGTFEKIDFTGKAAQFYINDTSHFPNVILTIGSQNNHSSIRLNTGANNTINEINLAADVYNLDKGIKINFRPSYFVLNDKKWNLEDNGELIITQNYTSAKNVKFTQGFQEISVETERGRRDTTANNNLVIKLNKVNIGDFTSLFMTSPRIEGLINGRIVMINFYGNFSVADSLQLEQMRFNGDSVGNIKSTGFYSGKTKNIHFTAVSKNGEYDFDIDGNYALNDSLEKPMDIVLNMRKMRINVLDRFLNTIFSNIDGYGYGKIEVVGKPANFRLLGNVKLSKASLDVIYTRVKYFIDTADFNFTDNSMDFGNFVIKDRYGNKANVHGILYHRSFNNMRFDFDVQSNKILALDTKPADNSLFYGKAIAKAEFVLKGSQQNMQMTITGEPADTCNINLLTTSTAISSTANFVVFKKYGKAVDNSPLQNTNMDLMLNLTANNKAKINVILDPLTGDAISATGNGTLKIHVPPTGNVTMTGKYNIEKGLYNFSFQSLIKKPFYFKDGDNNFIEWTGDPTNANLHIDAQYTADQVSLSPLVSAQSSLQSETGMNDARSYRGDVYVIVQLRGKLLKPDISFRFDFPAGSSVKSDPDFAAFLTRLQNDQGEMLKQVAYLIAFDAFAPYGSAAGNSTNFVSTGVNTISSLITNELNGMFSNALTKLTGDRGLHFEVGTQAYNSAQLLGSSGTDKWDRQNVNFRLMQSIANDKIIFVIGGNFDFGVNGGQDVQQTGGAFSPDLSVQFILSRNRRLRAVVFSRSSLGATSIGTIGRQNRYGVSISYTKDFEKLFADKTQYREIKLNNDTMTISQKVIPVEN